MKHPLLMAAAAATILALTTPLLVSHVESEPVVAAYFYVWYGEGRHWDSTVIDIPGLGYYSSESNATIEAQLRLIRDAGIDVLFISWWGPGPYEDRVAKKVFSHLKEFGLKAAILLEPYLGNYPNAYGKEWWSEALAYVKRNFIDAYPDTYFYLDGKPLVLAFNPIGECYNPSSDFPDYAIKIVGNDVGNGGYRDWDLWPDYLAPWVTSKNIELRLRRDGYVAIAPRFDDRIFCQHGGRENCGERLIDPNLELGAYRQQWEWILRNRDKVKIVAIYSWNEYHERSMIEPHHDATADVEPSYLYNITKEFIARIQVQDVAYGCDSSVAAVAGAVLALASAIALIVTYARRVTYSEPSSG